MAYRLYHARGALRRSQGRLPTAATEKIAVSAGGIHGCAASTGTLVASRCVPTGLLSVGSFGPLVS